MKVEYEVLEVKSTGDALELKMQGRKVDAPDWHPWLVTTMQLPDNQATRRAYYLGRKVVIDVQPC